MSQLRSIWLLMVAFILMSYPCSSNPAIAAQDRKLAVSTPAPQTGNIPKGVPQEYFQFARIPAGTLMMGSPASEPERASDETQHQVTLSRPFDLQTTLVTQALWQAVMGNNPSKSQGADLPVTNVSWDDARQFIGKLNQLLGVNVYRLPTEAEWEYAARAGTTTPFWTGANLTKAQANFDGDQTTPVKKYPPNPWGLYDMAGNVGQLVQDWLGSYPSGYGPYPGRVTDPTGPTRHGTIPWRVLRGGSYMQSRSWECRSATRGSGDPGTGSDNVGFRLARSVPTPVVVPMPQPSAVPTAGLISPQPPAGVPQEHFQFVRIPAGTFMMGSPTSEPEREDEETQHRVTISRPFDLQTTLVTQALWQAVMGNNPSKSQGADLPVTNVSWDDAQQFIGKLNQLLGVNVYRLPTEAEWEYAARAGTTTPFWTGENLTSEQANFDNQYEQTTPVKKFPPNPRGLYDMHGNVKQWVQDWFGSYPSGNVTDPTGPGTGEGRVNRGGSWAMQAGNGRSAKRGAMYPDNRDSDRGFRLARSVS